MHHVSIVVNYRKKEIQGGKKEDKGTENNEVFKKSILGLLCLNDSKINSFLI